MCVYVYFCKRKKRKTTEYTVLSRQEKLDRQHLELPSSNRNRKLTMSQQQSQPHNNINNSIAGKQRVSLSLISLANFGLFFRFLLFGYLQMFYFAGGMWNWYCICATYYMHDGFKALSMALIEFKDKIR